MDWLVFCSGIGFGVAVGHFATSFIEFQGLRRDVAALTVQLSTFEGRVGGKIAVTAREERRAQITEEMTQLGLEAKEIFKKDVPLKDKATELGGLILQKPATMQKVLKAVGVDL